MTQPALADPYEGAPLSLSVEERPEGWLIIVEGELDRSNHQLLVDAVQGLDGFVIVDTCALTFVDSRGLMALIDSRLHIGEERFEICLIPGGPLDRLIDATGLRDDFNLTLGHESV